VPCLSYAWHALELWHGDHLAGHGACQSQVIVLRACVRACVRANAFKVFVLVLCWSLCVSCRDLDDALSIQPLGNGRWRLGVHIADVASFVKPNTELDTEARARGTSV
jgi:hypothetical protein